MTERNYLPAAHAELDRLRRAEAAAWEALGRAKNTGNRYAIADAERAHDRAMLELGKHTFNPDA